jgi:hypothetical protein
MKQRRRMCGVMMHAATVGEEGAGKGAEEEIVFGTSSRRPGFHH